MKNSIDRLLDSSAGLLIFALLSGGAYFGVLYELIARSMGSGGLIMFFFCPAIVCGAAFILIKLIRQCRENEAPSKVYALFWIHTALIIISAVITAASFV